jgi:hypothetical protein
MPNDVLDDAPIEASSSLHNLPISEKPTIRILLYTDDPQEIVKGPAADLGLGLMINHLMGHAPAFANLSITYEPRYKGLGSKANNKINVVLDNADAKNEPFDQVWVFGLHQVNRKSFSLGVGKGGPESELDKAEISAFERRMDAGLGVLITGDHANRSPTDIVPLDPNSTCDDPCRGERFLGLGRALGRCIPRAGELRDWEGKPTAQPRFSFNTQVVISGTDVDDTGFQQDATPQQLILQSFNDKGRPSLTGQPHPLFFYRQGHAIRLFPDHLHEGAVVVPDSLSERWPKKAGVQPQPRVVAYGLDKRNGNLLKLVAAYDGDFVGAGRVVADSTWHHYFNVNLRSFRHPGAPFSATDQIGQYYRNLALWLTPLKLRVKMTEVMARWIAQQPSIAELVGPRPSKLLSEMMNTGVAAMELLTEVASACEIHELFQTLVPESKRRGYEAFYFPEKGFALSPLPSKELLLGALVHGVTLESAQTIALNMSTEATLAARQSAIVAASELAFKRQKLRVQRTARSLQRFVGGTSPSSNASAIKTESKLPTKLNNELSSERSFVMAICEGKEWDMTFTLDSDPEITDGLFFRNLTFAGGVIKGDVQKPLDNKISDLVGTCGPFVEGTQSQFTSLSFVFRLRTIGGEVGVFLAGFAFVRDDGKGVFLGRYRVFTPDANTPAATKEVEIAGILGTGSNDTGTGTGTQT